MKKAARVQHRKKQPAPCEFCGTLIRCDMYRHVARLSSKPNAFGFWQTRLHLVTKHSVMAMPSVVVYRLEGCDNMPQDLMDHVRGNLSARLKHKVQTRNIYEDKRDLYCSNLDLAQLWRCPAGVPFGRVRHRIFPPWTVMSGVHRLADVVSLRDLK